MARQNYVQQDNMVYVLYRITSVFSDMITELNLFLGYLMTLFLTAKVPCSWEQAYSSF